MDIRPREPMPDVLYGGREPGSTTVIPFKGQRMNAFRHGPVFSHSSIGFPILPRLSSWNPTMAANSIWRGDLYHKAGSDDARGAQGCRGLLGAPLPQTGVGPDIALASPSSPTRYTIGSAAGRN